MLDLGVDRDRSPSHRSSADGGRDIPARPDLDEQLLLSKQVDPEHASPPLIVSTPASCSRRDTGRFVRASLSSNSRSSEGMTFWELDHGEIHIRGSSIGHQESSEQAAEPARRGSILRRFFRVVNRRTRRIFLPIGFPNSVRAGYVPFHFWQASETFASSAVTVLCNQAMLQAIGVGADGDSASGSIGGAVAISWMAKDLLGEVGKLFFTERYSHTFDTRPKFWKLIGEVLASSASVLMLATAVAPSQYFLLLASVGNLSRALYYLTWSSVHVWFTRHFAQQNNISDLSAKSDSQMSVATVSGMLAGVGLLSYSHSPSFLFFCFCILTPIHWMSVVFLLLSTRCHVVTSSIASVLAIHFVSHGRVPSSEYLQREYLNWIDEPRARVVRASIVPQMTFCATADQLLTTFGVNHPLWRCFSGEKYLFAPYTAAGSPLSASPSWLSSFGDRYHIGFHPDVTAPDVLHCILHIGRFHFERQSAALPEDGSPDADFPDHDELIRLITSSSDWTKREFSRFVAELEDEGWPVDEIYFPDNGRRLLWESASSVDDDDASPPPARRPTSLGGLGDTCRRCRAD